jgi:tRNA threonylcarbamoyladenosine biosynthesis protein TsaE
MQLPPSYFTITEQNQLHRTAKELLTYAAGCKLWLLSGELGTGKTTLIKAICKNLGVVDYVNSPTFSLVHTYQLTCHTPVFHIDAYRINSITEAYDLDFEAYCYADQYCFIEWPEKIQSMIVPPYLSLFLYEDQKNTRKLKAQLFPT